MIEALDPMGWQERITYASVPRGVGGREAPITDKAVWTL